MVPLRYLPKKHFWSLDEGGSIRTVQLTYVFKKEKNKKIKISYRLPETSMASSLWFCVVLG